MTRLGSTFVSEDTDTRGQTGPAGNDSTVPGPAGEDSTVPGPAGDDGIVASVVAGTNITVDNTDPANPIVASTAAGSPTTTEGDIIQRGASADERLAIGTVGQVPTVNAGATALEYVTPAAGGSKIFSDTTTTGLVEFIEITGLTLQELDFEIRVPPASAPINVMCFVNSDTTQTNYRSQRALSQNTNSLAGEEDTARIGRIDPIAGTLFTGQVRRVDDNIQILVTMLSHQTTSQDQLERNGVLHEVTSTQITAIRFDNLTGNDFPIGTRLILLNPYV